jgi:sugar phosphate isomerase/epimerase
MKSPSVEVYLLDDVAANHYILLANTIWGKPMHTTRREMIVVGASLGAGLNRLRTANGAAGEPDQRANEPFGYCLNTSTIRGQNLGIVEVIEIAAKAGYTGIEPWIREFDEYTKQGGSLKDLAKRIRDLGLSVESAIGFPEWIVDDDARRARGFEEAKRNMEIVAAVGGTRLAAPPAGATDRADLNLFRAAERYRALLELGEKMGIVPQVELWGFSKSLSRLGEVAFVAIESGHPKACVLTDVYHIYKGGSDVTGLRMFRGATMYVMHINDYPADPPRDTITDAHRVYPGDGVAPIGMILRTLRDIGFRGMLSLELFNREYWKQDALTVARTGLEKMRAAVQKSLMS